MMKYIEKLRPKVRWIIAFPAAVIIAWVVRDVVGWMFLLNNPEISASAYNSTKGFTVAIVFVLAVTTLAPAHKKAVSMASAAFILVYTAFLAGGDMASDSKAYELALTDYLSLIVGAAGGLVPYWYADQEAADTSNAPADEDTSF